MYKIKKDIVDGSGILVKTNEEGRESFIPFDPDNQDFVEYQKWVAQGGVPTPADEETK
jgi:hypothetical protein